VPAWSGYRAGILNLPWLISPELFLADPDRTRTVGVTGHPYRRQHEHGGADQDYAQNLVATNAQHSYILSQE
jgi:hypothetical protein